MNWDEKAEDYAGAHHTYEHLGYGENMRFHKKFVAGAKWQRDQLRTDEAVARLANFLHDDERQETLEEHEAWCKAPECEARQSYNKHARAAIDALIGEEP